VSRVPPPEELEDWLNRPGDATKPTWTRKRILLALLPLVLVLFGVSIPYLPLPGETPAPAPLPAPAPPVLPRGLLVLPDAYDPALPAPPEHDDHDDDHGFGPSLRASAPSWGPGWPNCDYGKIRKATGGGVSVNVDYRLAELTSLLLNETARLGYRMDQTQTGAFVCRPIGGTSTASLHSFGVAIDINWRENQFSYAPSYTIPRNVIDTWKKYGWRWGGDWSGKKDTMHFERTDTPESAAASLARFKADRSPVVVPATSVAPEVGPWTLQPIVSWESAPEGGMILLGRDGSVYAFGATWFPGANGQPWFAGRTAARIDYIGTSSTAPRRWQITATSGETYHLPLA
jgi:hypothetical protein